MKWSSPRIPKGPDRPAWYVSRDLVFPMLLEPLKVPSRWATVEAPRVLARVGRPESRLTLRVSARTPRRKACSQWRTWKCRLMHRRDDPDHAERPRAPLGGNKGIGGDEGFNDMIRTEASVAVFEVLCLDLLAESKILPLARRPSGPPFGCPMEATMTPKLDNGAASLNRATSIPTD